MEPTPTPEAVVEALRRVLSSAAFHNAARSSALLKFLVEETLNDRSDRLKEYTLGAEALEKGDSFDPRTDPIVRAEVSRLRGRLDRYYETEGRLDPLAIVLPRGTYVPRFHQRTASLAKDDGARSIHGMKWAVTGAVVVAFLSSVAAWMTLRTAAAVNRPLVRLEVELKSSGVLGSDVGTDVVLSPDGTRVVFVSRDAGGHAHLYTRRLDQPVATEIRGTEGVRAPFLSPDGRWVGFWADRKLKKVAVDGGPPTVICDAPDLLGGSWGDDGAIVAAFTRSQLVRVSSAGGSPGVVADFAGESITPLWPQVLPGGNLILFTAVGPAGPNMATIRVLSASDRKIRTVVRGGTFGRYLANGYLAFVNQGTLFAAPFDLERLQLRGSVVPILDDVSYSSTFGYAQADISRDGTLVYRRSPGGGQFVVSRVRASGVADPLIAKPAHYGWPRISPDGERVALTVTESGVESVAVFDARSKRVERLGTIPSGYGFPLWTRDGRSIVVGGPRGLATADAGGRSISKTLVDTRAIAVPWSFSPDGRRLAYYAMGASTGFDLWTVPITDGADGLHAGTPEAFLESASFEAYPSFSPDGRWLAYSSNESGTWEIYVRKFPDDGMKVVISTSGGHIPVWLPNGRDLLYENEDHRLFVVSYTADRGSFHPSAPREWGQTVLGDTGVLANLDISHDGASVIALMPGTPPADEQTPNHVTLVLNFFDELRRRGLQ
jgi:eukaryotic-like serine/threonine-protein kinase